MKFSSGGKKSFRKPASSRTASIVVAGDYCPWQDQAANDVLKGRTPEICADVMPFLCDADLRVIQFETPLLSDGDPISKSGPNIKSPAGCEKFALDAGFDVAALANNHIGDFGPAPVLATKRILEKAGIKTVGVGADLNEARRPLRMKINGLDTAILNFAEHEFGTAGPAKPGSASLDPLQNISDIREAKKKDDICFVIVHGGNEYNPIPSPRMKQCYRAFADAGASAVINIHTHCPQGVELWNGVPIVYSPGNFFFPANSIKYDPANFWFYGYLPKITFDKKGAFRIDIEPFRFKPDPWRITALEGKERSGFMEYLCRISEIAADDKESLRYYEAWCALEGAKYVGLLKDRLKTWPIDTNKKAQVKPLMAVRNLFTCETHCEFMRQYLRLIEEYRLKKAESYIPKLEKLRKASFAPRKRK